MLISEQIDLINEIENNFPVDQWVLDGIHIWPLVRINIMFQLYDFSNNPDNITKKDWTPVTAIKNRFQPLNASISYFKAYLKDYKNNAKPEKGYDAIFLNHSTCRALPVNGKMYDVFCDPFISILDSLKIKSFVLEFATHNEYLIPRYNSSMFIDLSILFLRIKIFLFRRNTGDASDFFNDYEYLKEYLRRRISGFKLCEYSSIHKQIKFIRSVADYFKKIFSVINPRMGFVVCYYGGLGMAFNLACREFGIPSADIQHGVQGSLHAAYGRWLRLPVNGYELLPSLFLCWGEKEASVIEEWTNKVSKWHKPVVLGNLYLNMFKDDDNSIVEDFRLKINKIINQENSQLNILITLQTGRGLQNIFKDTIAEAPESWFWWVRLHSGMDAEKDEIMKNLIDLHVNNFNLEDASELPLHGLLPHMDVHVTEWSTTVIEAEQFGVPSVMTNTIGCEYYANLISSGIAVAAFTKDDLIKKISDQASRKKKSEFECTAKFSNREISLSAIQSLVAQFKERKAHDFTNE